MTDPVLRLDGLARTFGATRAVDDLSLSVERGEFFALLGPSGCGKTTTLRLVTGLERPDEGRVVLDGTDVTDVPPSRRDVHLVFQDLVLFPHMTVAENVGYGLRRAGWDRERREARVANLLEVVGLPDAGDRDPAALSGGQRQRVALARSLAPEPAVLLLDEPLSSLDRRLREELRTELKRVQAEVGTTFVYVTHDQESAMRLADRLAVMRDGRPVEVGSPERLYERPRTEFVARFFSDANVLSGRPSVADGNANADANADGSGNRDGRDRVDVRGLSVPLVGGVPDGTVDAAGAVTVVVRPAAVRVGVDDGDGLPATVRSVAYRGEGYEYDLALADGTVVRARTTADAGAVGDDRRDAPGRLAAGAETRIRFAAATVVATVGVAAPDDDGAAPATTAGRDRADAADRDRVVTSTTGGGTDGDG